MRAWVLGIAVWLAAAMAAAQTAVVKEPDIATRTAMLETTSGAGVNDWTNPVSGMTRNFLYRGECLRWDITDSTTGRGKMLWVGGIEIAAELEPDSSGATTTCEVTLQSCSVIDGDNDGTADTDGCLDYQWDTDGNGVVDNADLDGNTVMKRGVSNIKIPGWFNASLKTAPGSGETCHLMVCGMEGD